MQAWDRMVEPLRGLWEHARTLWPNLSLSLAIVVVGVVLAWLLREGTYRLLRAMKFDRLATRMGLATAMERVGRFRTPSYLAGQCVEGLVVVAAVLIGLEALDTRITDLLVARVVGYLPNVVMAGFILLLGGIVSRFLARGVLLAGVNAGMRGVPLVSGLVRFFIMALAVVAALNYLGIGRTTILLAFGIVFGGVVAALAVAFGLGGRDLAREVLEGQLRERRKGAREKEGVQHL